MGFPLSLPFMSTMDDQCFFIFFLSRFPIQINLPSWAMFSPTSCGKMDRAESSGCMLMPFSSLHLLDQFYKVF